MTGVLGWLTACGGDGETPPAPPGTSNGSSAEGSSDAGSDEVGSASSGESGSDDATPEPTDCLDGVDAMGACTCDADSSCEPVCTEESCEHERAGELEPNISEDSSGGVELLAQLRRRIRTNRHRADARPLDTVHR